MTQVKPVRMAHSRKPARPTRMGLMEDPVLSDRDKEVAAAGAEGVATVLMYSNGEQHFPKYIDGLEAAYGKQNVQEIMRLTEKAQELMAKLGAENAGAIVAADPGVATMSVQNANRQRAQLAAKMSKQDVDAAVSSLTRHR